MLRCFNRWPMWGAGFSIFLASPLLDNYTFCVTLGHIVELLTFCVEHHTYHIKNYVISKDLLKRVLILMASKHKFLVLSEWGFFVWDCLTVFSKPKDKGQVPKT